MQATVPGGTPALAFEVKQQAGGRVPAARAETVFGRVPLVCGVLHIYLIHAVALIVGTLAGFDPRQLLPRWQNTIQRDGGYGLPIVYLVWVGVVPALYPASRWLAGLKARRREAWLSYL